MQCLKFPVKITSKIDQIIRKFLWGNRAGQSQLHLTNWNSVIKPKNLGGLQIKSAKHQNISLLANLDSKNQHRRWVQILKSKYIDTLNPNTPTKSCSSASYIWKSLLLGWELCKIRN